MATPTPDGVLAEIRAEMGRQRISQTNLAASMHDDLSPSGLSRRLTGETPLLFVEFVAICAALGVPAHEMVRRAQTTAAVA